MLEKLFFKFIYIYIFYHIIKIHKILILNSYIYKIKIKKYMIILKQIQVLKKKNFLIILYIKKNFLMKSFNKLKKQIIIDIYVNY